MLEIRDVVLGGCQEKLREILLGLIVALPGAGVLDPAHQVRLGATQREIEGVGLVLPALITVVVIGIISHVRCGRCRQVRGGIRTRCRKKFRDENLDNLQRGWDDGELVWVCGRA